MPGVAVTSRRYLGNKASIAPWIVARTEAHLGHYPASVVDAFAERSVAAAFNRSDTCIVANDLLYCNYVCLRAFLGTRHIRPALMQTWISALNEIRSDQDNYVSQHFGDRYWRLPVARQIGAVRTAIDTLPAQADERPVLLATLLYAADRIANTCGHYDAWRAVPERPEPLVLRLPEFDTDRNRGNLVTCSDTAQAVQHWNAEVVYLDPPYNSRQYSDTYHVLENLARWEQPEVHGVARKVDRSHLKSDYCTRRASKAFSELTATLDARLLVVSYNNMGKRGDPRSNASIPDEVIWESLGARGDVTVEEREFPHFNAGKRTLEGHRERLFFCRVTR